MLTETVVCLDCKALFDVSLGLRPHLDPRGSKAVAIKCPVQADHEVRPWNTGDECPKCGATMERIGEPILWD